jgi:hypothetical protein
MILRTVRGPVPRRRTALTVITRHLSVRCGGPQFVERGSRVRAERDQSAGCVTPILEAAGVMREPRLRSG